MERETHPSSLGSCSVDVAGLIRGGVDMELPVPVPHDRRLENNLNILVVSPTFVSSLKFLLSPCSPSPGLGPRTVPSLCSDPITISLADCVNNGI